MDPCMKTIFGLKFASKEEEEKEMEYLRTVPICRSILRMFIIRLFVGMFAEMKCVRRFHAVEKVYLESKQGDGICAANIEEKIKGVFGVADDVERRLNILSYLECATNQVCTKLTQHTFTPENFEKATQCMIDNGYLSHDGGKETWDRVVEGVRSMEMCKKV